MFDWETSNTLDGWLENVSNCGGTFGNFWGWYDTNAKSTPIIRVRLNDGRVFDFAKKGLYQRRATQELC